MQVSCSFMLYDSRPCIKKFSSFSDVLNAKEKMLMRILIIEDEKDLANVLSEMLELEGYHTDIPNDGE